MGPPAPALLPHASAPATTALSRLAEDEGEGNDGEFSFSTAALNSPVGRRSSAVDLVGDGETPRAAGGGGGG
ncbi:MAG: hypothetical protein ACK4ZJ_17220, partial [Allorhizobium sp.]